MDSKRHSFSNTISRTLILLVLKDCFIPTGVRNKSLHFAFVHKTRCLGAYNHQHAVNFHFRPFLKAQALLLNPSSAPQVHHLQPINPTHNFNWSAAAVSVHASSASLLSQYRYMRSWPPVQEGWGSTACAGACVHTYMSVCTFMAQWEVDTECFWLDNWFAPAFTFNLWWAWPAEGSQSGTAGFIPKRLNGLSKSHPNLCHSLTNAHWEFSLHTSMLRSQILQSHKNNVRILPYSIFKPPLLIKTSIFCRWHKYNVLSWSKTIKLVLQ